MCLWLRTGPAVITGHFSYQNPTIVMKILNEEIGGWRPTACPTRHHLEFVCRSNPWIGI